MQRSTLSQFDAVSTLEGFVKRHDLIINFGNILHLELIFSWDVVWSLITFIMSLQQPDILVIVRNPYCRTRFLFLGLIPKPRSIAVLVKTNQYMGKKPGHEKSENSGSKAEEGGR